MKRLRPSNEKGQSMIEYGLLIALISIAVLAVLVFLGPRIAGIFQTANTELEAVAT